MGIFIPHNWSSVSVGAYHLNNVRAVSQVVWAFGLAEQNMAVSETPTTVILPERNFPFWDFNGVE